MWCTPATRPRQPNYLDRDPAARQIELSRRLSSPSCGTRTRSILRRPGTVRPYPWWSGARETWAGRRSASIDAHPGLELAAVLVSSPAKVGRDAGELAGLDRDLGVAATTDVDAALATLGGAGAVAYMASGDIRPDAAAADVARCLRGGAVVVTPALYALYDHRSAPAELTGPLLEAAKEGGERALRQRRGPGLGQRRAARAGQRVAGTVDEVRCQEIFDYSTYDQPDSVRLLVGMGQPMDYEPPMVAAGVPTMVWGGQVRMIARALGVELDEIRETLERRPLEADVTNAMGLFEAGTQGALRFEVQGIVDGVPRIVIEHVTRIGPDCAPDWPLPPDGGAGAHRVVIEGRPRIEVSLEATDEGGNRAAGGNATAANRLVNAIPWLTAAEPGLYDGLDVPLTPASGRIGRSTP